MRLCLTLRLVWIMLRHDIWLWVANMLEKEACSCAGQFPGGSESSVVRVQVAPTDKYLSRKSSGTKEHMLVLVVAVCQLIPNRAEIEYL